MTTEYAPRSRALGRIVESLALHQPVSGEEGIGKTCRNRACKGVIFLDPKDACNHQAIVLANDLQAEPDFALEVAREDAAEDGLELGAEQLAKTHAGYLVLAPAPEDAPAGEAFRQYTRRRPERS